MKRVFVFICAVLLSYAAFAEGQMDGSAESSLQEAAGALSRMETTLENRDADVTLEDGYYIGRAAGAHIVSRYRPWDNQKLTGYLADILTAIVINSPRPEHYTGYSVMLLDSPEINAFSTPGGHVFITRGLAALADSEDALAAVIAHEIAHIQLEHAAGIINDTQLVRDLAEVSAASASTAAKAANADEQTVDFHNSVTAMIHTILENGYSQAQEFEADRYALFLLASAGYDPKALVEMLTILDKEAVPGKGLYGTHPSPAGRIANISRITDQYRMSDTREARKNRFINK